MRTDSYKMACVFGGTGFIGRQIVRALAKEGYTIKVATRVPESAYFLRTCGNVGQIVPFTCNYNDESSIRASVKGCEVVVNCVGALYEKGKSSFTRVHTEFPRAIAKACTAEKVGRFIHISAGGCDESHSKYGKSKLNGEMAAAENFPSVTVLRPSVVFGAEDNFFNMFARLSLLLPALPLIGGGATKFQPVYVGDIALAVVAALHDGSTAGKTFSLGGPEVLTFKEIYGLIFKETGRKRCLFPLPWGIAKIQGGLMGLLPSPLLTADQVESLKTDNIVPVGAAGFEALGIVPTGPEAVLPSYLARYRPGGRFGDKKRA
ncbi:MAG: complex I NDUFA9 subunit family protein [Micavibrio aeruginosavorus]|uniref:Complex I NDUFA9 subunit family protein n=1 Tax=Micavibrio aeruginosavorus TaxID=349221 RepID=A0A2W5N4W9_9BACT|nr:MAG: complex I NDUFA9 subunit family protein [Micavibrio aeruginosavorus]